MYFKKSWSLISSILLIFISWLAINSTSIADVVCRGKIEKFFQWDTHSTFSISILLEDGSGNTNWLRMPSKSQESLALTAFAMNKDITIKWADPAKTQCINGWAHYEILDGWLSIK